MPLGLVPAITVKPSLRPCGAEPVPPRGFRVAEGVRSAWLIGEGPFGRTPRRAGTLAQRNGRRYEKAALAHLSGLLGRGFTPSQWFRFQDGGRVPRYCQTDGILVDSAGVVIFEVKRTFTELAWWQLRKLYEPVVRCALSPKRIQHVIVCKSYDPATTFPEPYEHTELLNGWRDANTISVYQWRG